MKIIELLRKHLGNTCTKFSTLQVNNKIRINQIQRTIKAKAPAFARVFSFCAREETRTPTSFTSQASETCASTNFATRAEVEMLRITLPRKRLV